MNLEVYLPEIMRNVAASLMLPVLVPFTIPLVTATFFVIINDLSLVNFSPYSPRSDPLSCSASLTRMDGLHSDFQAL